MVLEDGHVGVRARGREQPALDLAAGGVLGVRDAPLGVAAFAREVERAAAVAIEVDAEALDHLAHGLGPFAHAQLDDVAVAQPFADGERVLDVLREAVVLGIEHRRDPALRVVGVRLRRGALGADRHPAVLGGVERERQPRDAGAEHEIIGLDHERRVDS